MAASIVVARLDAPKDHPWIDTFLKNLGHGAAGDFTVQDWLDEFEIEPKALFDLLNLLCKEGVVVRSPARGLVEDNPETFLAKISVT